MQTDDIDAYLVAQTHAQSMASVPPDQIPDDVLQQVLEDEQRDVGGAVPHSPLAAEANVLPANRTPNRSPASRARRAQADATRARQRTPRRPR